MPAQRFNNIGVNFRAFTKLLGAVLKTCLQSSDRAYTQVKADPPTLCPCCRHGFFLKPVKLKYAQMFGRGMNSSRFPQGFPVTPTIAIETPDGAPRRDQQAKRAQLAGAEHFVDQVVDGPAFVESGGMTAMTESSRALRPSGPVCSLIWVRVSGKGNS